jgi:hypothetical protein
MNCCTLNFSRPREEDVEDSVGAGDCDDEDCEDNEEVDNGEAEASRV